MFLELNDTGMTDGFSISVGEYIYRQIFERLEYPAIFEPDGIVVDIGGHIGLFTLFASQYVKTGKIYTYEPSPFNYKKLINHIEKNSIENVITKNIAVTGDGKDVTLFLSQDTGANSIYKKCAHEYFIPNTEIDNINVKSTTLSEILKNVGGKISYLKLDCEGAEYTILESISNEEFSNIDKIILEYHPVDGKSVKNLENLLLNNNYDVKITGDANYGMMYAIRKKDTY
jgi:FkbM family methyltransferase